MSLRISLDAGVLHATLDRPDRYNAIDAELRDALIEMFDNAEERESRAILLSGAGKGFCAGADLREGGARVAGIDLERRMTRSSYRLVRAVLAAAAATRFVVEAPRGRASPSSRSTVTPGATPVPGTRRCRWR